MPVKGDPLANDSKLLNRRSKNLTNSCRWSQERAIGSHEAPPGTNKDERRCVVRGVIFHAVYAMDLGLSGLLCRVRTFLPGSGVSATEKLFGPLPALSLQCGYVWAEEAF